MFFWFKEKEAREHPAIARHRMREAKWAEFISQCERFDYVEFTNGCATGRNKGDKAIESTLVTEDGAEIPITFDQGRSILIPLNYIEITYT
jgi:hypothetical protein